MPKEQTHHDLVGLFIATAQAHHRETGGVNPQWAQWYAEHLVEDLNRVADEEMTVEELTTWLEGADRRYREEEPEQSWPKAYASWLLEAES